MTTNNFLLSFELSKDKSELDIHFDEAGLAKLIAVLSGLNNGPPQHEHMMTQSWGGTELSEEPQSPDSYVLNKVTIHKW
jgi:hypothetical protein